MLIVISYLFKLYQPLFNFFSVNGNITGFFQYPNTFALFLLLGIIVIVNNISEDKIKSKTTIFNCIKFIILLFGIIETGSRTIFILLIALFIISIFIKDFRKTSVLFLILGAVLGTISFVILLCIGNTEFFSRIASISIFESTFIGRILYMKDAVIPILTNPLGLGYMGYRYIEGAIQTGVYDVTYVHNDFLQMFLDGGYIAGISLIVLVVKSLKDKSLDVLPKMIILFISLSCMLDFHLQYMSIFFILLICFRYNVHKLPTNSKEKSKTTSIKKQSKITVLVQKIKEK
ncbi:MAG: O-antigen ligase family protein [Clostridia bacterium]